LAGEKAELPISKCVITSYRDWWFRNGYCSTLFKDMRLYQLLKC